MFEISIFFTTLIVPLISPPVFSFPSSWQKIVWQPPSAIQFNVPHPAYAKENINACFLNFCPAKLEEKLTSEYLEKVPKEGFFLLVDVTKNQEYIFQDGELIEENPVSTGSLTRFKKPQGTPIGKWQISKKISTDPQGEYGSYFLTLDRLSGKDFVESPYGLHGTNEPELLGQDSSHGCIRHSNEVITHLYEILPIGTIVETVE